jgi:hypothetical protein
MIPDILIQYFITRTLRNLPALITLGVCAMIVLSQWQRHPRMARWALFAFLWFLTTDLLALFWYTIGIEQFLMENPNADVAAASAMSETVLSCLEAFGYVLVMLALNAARTPYRPPEFFDDQRDFEERVKAIQNDAYTAEPPPPKDIHSGQS